MTSTEENFVNFVDIEEKGSFDPLPSGNYVMEITDWTQSEVKNGANKGKRRDRIELTVPDSAEEYSSRKVWDSLTATQTSLWKYKQVLTALNFDHLDSLRFNVADEVFSYTDEDGDEVELDTDDFVGKMVNVKLGIRPASKDKVSGEEYDAQNQVKNYKVYEASDDDLMP